MLEEAQIYTFVLHKRRRKKAATEKEEEEEDKQGKQQLEKHGVRAAVNKKRHLCVRPSALRGIAGCSYDGDVHKKGTSAKEWYTIEAKFDQRSEFL